MRPVHTADYYSVRKREKGKSGTCYNTNEPENVMLSGIRQSRGKLYDSTQVERLK